MTYWIGNTLFDACENIRQRLADGVTPEEAAPYIKLMAIMDALGDWDRPPSDNDEYQSLCDAVVTAWNGLDITPVLAAGRAMSLFCEQFRIEQIMQQYIRITDGEKQSAFRDLLTDLRHYAAKYELDFEFAVEGSSEVFDEEVEQAEYENTGPEE